MLTPSISNCLAFRNLPLAGLVAELLPPVNLFLPSESAKKAQLYRSSELEFKTTDINLLRANGVNHLWVDPADYEKIKHYFSANLALLLGNESHPPHER